MEKERTKSVSFSGHRPEKITNCSEQEIRRATADAIALLYRQGFNVFLSGMAPGFDLWAADEVVNLRDRLGVDLQLVAVIPFVGHENTITSTYKSLYKHIIAEADSRVTVCDHYSPLCYRMRNDYLVAHADTLVCYFEGAAGGTKYTVAQARKTGLPITNLALPELF